MKALLRTCCLLAVVGTISIAVPNHTWAQDGAAHATEETIRRGAPIGDAQAVALSTVLQNPQAYTRNPVVVEGVVDRACTTKGCWLQLAPAAGEEGVRVTFKDYAFFIPMNAAGMKARAQGIMTVKRLSKKDADHLAAEGAKLTRNPDGTATEISFVASGVELRP
jgi:hypothetical protein